jgi:signal peptidase II
MDNKNRGLIAILVIVLVIIIDQASKIWIKTHMYLGEEISITSWFKIYFVENPGMAFGLELGGEGNKAWGKLFLSLFRIVAIGFIGYYLYTLVKKGYSKGFIACIALILAGAFGNIIDSVFYGVIFSESYAGHVASFVPIGEGYSSWLHGRVVDMLQFPLIKSTFPSWFPVWGGEKFVFFSPIFNIADSAITVGIFILLIFYRKTLSISLEKKDNV